MSRTLWPEIDQVLQEARQQVQEAREWEQKVQDHLRAILGLQGSQIVRRMIRESWLVLLEQERDFIYGCWTQDKLPEHTIWLSQTAGMEILRIPSLGIAIYPVGPHVDLLDLNQEITADSLRQKLQESAG